MKYPIGTILIWRLGNGYRQVLAYDGDRVELLSWHHESSHVWRQRTSIDNLENSAYYSLSENHKIDKLFTKYEYK